MISTSDGCYRHFLELQGLDGDGDPDLVGLFAYALVERDRIDWIDHRKANGFDEPSVDEIQAWYRGKPPSFFDEKLRGAATRFDLYARGYLAEDMDAAKKVGARDAFGTLPADVRTSKVEILAAIEAAKDTSPHWWRGGFQGAFGNVIFLVLAIFLLWLLAQPSDVLGWVRTHFHL